MAGKKGTNLSPDSVIDLLRQQREKEREDDERREKHQRNEHEGMLKELQSLQAEQTQIVKNINKNLKTIVTSMHGLEKMIQGSKSDSQKLPVTHKQQEAAINFVSDAINLVNNFAEIQKSVAPQNDIDTTKLCDKIKTCGESVNQELSRSNTRVNQVAKLMENAEIIKNHCFIPCDDDDQDLMG